MKIYLKISVKSTVKRCIMSKREGHWNVHIKLNLRAWFINLHQNINLNSHAHSWKGVGVRGASPKKFSPPRISKLPLPQCILVYLAPLKSISPPGNYLVPSSALSGYRPMKMGINRWGPGKTCPPYFWKWRGFSPPLSSRTLRNIRGTCLNP